MVSKTAGGATAVALAMVLRIGSVFFNKWRRSRKYDGLDGARPPPVRKYTEHPARVAHGPPTLGSCRKPPVVALVP